MLENFLTQELEIEKKLLLEAIHLKYNYDFRGYSTESIKRRLLLAMNELGCRSLSALQEKVLYDENCLYDLLQCLTVPVSEMFRDPAYFHSLRETVIPQLKNYPTLKVWIAGCSTGEEAYSLAILLYEEGLLDRTIIYATDINPRSLEKAEKAVFNLSEIQKFTLNYQKSGGKVSFSDYYTAAFGSAKLVNTLKKNITFANHNLVTDNVFSETHLISCRNVFIYFKPKLQERVLKLFNKSLYPKCFLGLGSAEAIQFLEHKKYFNPFVENNKIFQKKQDTT